MRIAMGVEYDGTAYVGWQRQKSGPGVQAVVEKGIGVVANEQVEVTCAGRTDTGVHACGQVVHFDTVAERTDRGWLLGINSVLPDDVNVTWVKPVSDAFHARFSASSRSYRYLVFNRLARSGLHRLRAWWVHDELDEQRMHAGAQHLLGRHDFSAFRAAGCQAATPVRDLQAIRVNREREWLILTVTANAFLQHMVRNIAGALVAIGKGEQPPGWMAELLRSGDRTAGGVAAPPCGLTLTHVTYPNKFGLAEQDPEPPLLLG